VNILFAAAEMSPLPRSAGCDVADRCLALCGQASTCAAPLFYGIDRSKPAIEPCRCRRGAVRGGERVAVYRSDSRVVPVYLLEHERYFGRPNVYGDDDDQERFLFFCDALLAAAPRLAFLPDAVHAQDWHTGLLFTRLATLPDHRPAPDGSTRSTTSGSPGRSTAASRHTSDSTRAH
jgi:starch synthase